MPLNVAASASKTAILTRVFGAVLLTRLLFPFFNSPLDHLFSDPERHWTNGLLFMHPGLIGAGDPLLYQVWIALLQWLAQGSAPVVNLGCGVLCALMPYGWYLALRERVSMNWGLGGAIVIGLWPEAFGIYAYFMNETLLLTLTGFAFWASFRALRRGDGSAFALACLFWSAASFTRTIAGPLGLVCLGLTWLAHSSRGRNALIGVCVVALFAVPAAWRSSQVLGFAAPLGNLYLNEIYAASGENKIAIDAGRAGGYWFVAPSFARPTFEPFSTWLTDRTGTFTAHIDTANGRRDWVSEKERAQAERTFPRWRQRLEDGLYLLFAPSWPDGDGRTLSGRLSTLSRWLWLPLICTTLWGVRRGLFEGADWLLPGCGLIGVLLLGLQSEAIIEGRYRKPVEPILVAAAVIMTARRRSGMEARVGIEPA